MKKKYSLRRIALLLITTLSGTILAQQPSLTSIHPQKGAFSLTDCHIVYDDTDYSVVKKTVELFSSDLKKVTGYQPIITNKQTSGNIIILGTLGRNSIIDQLIAQKKIDVSSIKGGWEQFLIKRLDNPLPGVKQALVIVGSDRRGTAYGAFTISRDMGVSPWEWWADVPAKKHSKLFVVKDYISVSPSIKYRGIFMNDEDWGLKPWSSNNYEKELGDIGPKTYSRICELILRLKGNFLAPAMHSCTGAFYSILQNKVVADQYGIIVSTSHCEPLLFNNAAKSEWDRAKDGDWNYATNKTTILKKLDDRVNEASPYENIYTVGLRGLHDAPMEGKYPMSEKVKIVDSAIVAQRAILETHLQKPATDIPQIYVPYKEALDVYNEGLNVPDDITLVWTDDNYGYIKRLSNAEERKRSGASGVYYHLSYLGPPHDYLWLCTTPPVLMFEELKKAYDTGANRYWLLNVGDIKPAEMEIQTYFDMAWNINDYNYNTINSNQSQFLSDIFGIKNKKIFQYILDNYYRLAWSRKPECMGWEREWDAQQYKELSDTQFSFQNYNDAQQRISDYKEISDLSKKILDEIPQNYRPAFFEMVGYPMMASYQINRKFLLAQLNHEKARTNDWATANWAAIESKAAYDSINSLTKTYNTLLHGKWNLMMKLAPGLCAKYQDMPNLETNGTACQEMDLKPQKDKRQLSKCTVIDLQNFKRKLPQGNHTLKLITGIGYDWTSIQLGDATETKENPKDLNSSRFEYEFSCKDEDSVTVYIYTIPTFPLNADKGTLFGVSVDSQPPFVAGYTLKEFSKEWKDRVLQNGTLIKTRFPLRQKTEQHSISLICGDPGVIIQKIIIDWGGLEKTYVGPNLISNRK